MIRYKLSFTFVVSLATLFLLLDLNLFHQIQSMRFDQNLSLAIPSITAKHVMLDHLNSYIMSPLSFLLDEYCHVTRALPWLTANHVSLAGVLVALVAARVVVNDSLHARRLSVAIFLLRQFLDDFDGLVARVRLGVDRKREISIPGTSGYAMDGICDAIGFTLYVIGVFVQSVRSLRARTETQKYKLLLGDEEAGSGGHPTTRTDQWTARDLLRDHLLFGLQMALSCVLWNRYIDCFHVTLETHVTAVKVELFKSRLQWLIMWAWRLVGNAHQLMNFFLLSVWFSRSTQFVRKYRFVGFLVILGVSLLTEVHVHDIETYLKSISMNNNK